MTYTPEPGYHGPDSFSYTVTDDEMAGGRALTSAAETVSITITDAHWAAVAVVAAVLLYFTWYRNLPSTDTPDEAAG